LGSSFGLAGSRKRRRRVVAAAAATWVAVDAAGKGGSEGGSEVEGDEGVPSWELGRKKKEEEEEGR